MLSYGAQFKMKKHRLYKSIIALPLAINLSGCLIAEEAKQAHTSYLEKQQQVTKLDQAILKAKTPETKSVSVHVRDKPYLGLKQLPAPKGERLPENLLTGHGVTIPFETNLTTSEIANRISAATQLPVVLKGTVKTSEDDTEETYTPVSNIVAVDTQNIVWQGPLDTLLNQWTSYNGYEWNYDGQQINIIRTGASVFTINALAGIEHYSTKQSSSSELEGANSLSAQSLSSDFKYNLFEELEQQTKAIVDEKNTIVKASAINGTITVKGKPGDIRTVGNFLNHLNERILRTVTLSVRVLDVQIRKSADYNLDFNVLLADVLGKQGIQFVTGGTSNLIGTVRPLPNGATSNAVSATIQALNSIGTISRDLNGTVAALNGQPVPLEKYTRRDYLANSKSVNVEGVVSSSFVVDTIIDGYYMSFLPRIIEGDKVRVRMNLGINETVEIREREAGDNVLQFPEVASEAIRIERLIRSGDTLVIAGITDNRTNSSRSGVGEADFLLLGGNQDGELIRKEQVILLSAEVEPALAISEYKADIL